MQPQRYLITSSLKSPASIARNRVIGYSVSGAGPQVCTSRTGRTQYLLPHQTTSCLPTKTVRTFTSGSTFFFRSSQQLQLFNFSNKQSDSGVMSLQKVTLSEGDGKTYPKTGQTVIMEYTGWVYSSEAADNRGKQFDSSVGRGDFETEIGVGRVIQGWDQGVPQMSLGERAVLTIPGKMAYGSRGFPGLIPPNATLIFEVVLKGIK